MSQGALDTTLGRMKAWVRVVKQIIEAEFPQFSLICSLSVFCLQPAPSADLSPAVRTKLQRLANTFNKKRLEIEFADHLPWALQSFADAQGSFWNAWACAVRQTRGMRGSAHPSDDLAYVVQRGICFAPTTSPIEQSFSKVAERLGSKRLNANASTEACSVGLLVLNLDEPGLEALARMACDNYKRCFGHCDTREHFRLRA